MSSQYSTVTLSYERVPKNDAGSFTPYTTRRDDSSVCKTVLCAVHYPQDQLTTTFWTFPTDLDDRHLLYGPRKLAPRPAVRMPRDTDVRRTNGHCPYMLLYCSVIVRSPFSVLPPFSLARVSRHSRRLVVLPTPFTFVRSRCYIRLTVLRNSVSYCRVREQSSRRWCRREDNHFEVVCVWRDRNWLTRRVPLSIETAETWSDRPSRVESLDDSIRTSCSGARFCVTCVERRGDFVSQIIVLRRCSSVNSVTCRRKQLSAFHMSSILVTSNRILVAELLPITNLSNNGLCTHLTYC